MKHLITLLLTGMLAFSVQARDAEGEGESGVNGETAEALFAGGCFWCMQPPYDELEGVKDTIVGFSGGHVTDPSYKQVTSGGTGHREAIKVIYDPQQVSYQELLDVFWRNIDPLDEGGQFCDRGEHYRAAVFPLNGQQEELALASRKAINDSGRFDQTVETDILTAKNFYPAEEYHQDYYKKNPLRYQFYTRSCGRYSRLEELWGD